MEKDISAIDEGYLTNIDDINQRLSEGQQPMVNLNAATGGSTSAKGALEAKYKGFEAFLDKADVGYTVKHTLHGWNVELTDGSKKGPVTIFMPDHTTGFISVAGSKYRVTPRIQAYGSTADTVMAFDFGTTVMKRAVDAIEPYTAIYLDRIEDVVLSDMPEGKVRTIREKKIGDLKKAVKKAVGGDIATDSPAEVVKLLFDRTISSHTDEYIGDVHPASALQQRFIVPELELPSIESHLEKSQITMAQTFRTYTDRKGQMRNVFGLAEGWAGEWELFVPGTSEATAIKAKISTKSPFWVTPFMSYGKQSQQRIDWMRGKPIKGTKLDFNQIKLGEGAGTVTAKQQLAMAAIKLGALLGPAPRDVLEQIAQSYGESFPGRMTNLGFYFDIGADMERPVTPRGELAAIGDGSVIFVARESSPLEAKARMNLEDFTGMRPKAYKIRSRKGSGKDVYTSQRLKEAREMIETKLSDNKLVWLDKGTMIGYDPITKKDVKLGVKSLVDYMYEKDGELTLHVREEVPLTTGAKITLNKAQVTKIITRYGIGKEIGDTLGELLSHGDSQVGVEALMNSSMLDKYKGGGVGLGVMQQVLHNVSMIERDKNMSMIKRELAREVKTGVKSSAIRDLEKKIVGSLESISEYMLGTNAYKSGVEKIALDETFNVAVILRGATEHMDRITTDNAMFFKLKEVEDLLTKGEMGDWRPLIEWSENLEKHIKGVADVGKFKIADDRMNRLRMDAVDKRNMPSPIFTMVGMGKGDPGMLSYMAMRAPAILHKESAYMQFRVATGVRSPQGYAGGFKMTIDHIRNASIMGMDHYVRYLEQLRDYNLPYIRNKYIAAEAKVLQGLSLHKGGPMAIELDSGLSLKTKAKSFSLWDLDKSYGTDIVGRLATDIAENESIQSFIKFRIATDHSANIIGELGDDFLEESLLRGDGMTTDDLMARGKLGLRGNSLGITDADTMRKLMETINNRKEGEVVYLELPTAIDVGDETGRFIPLHDFNQGDLFELSALDREGNWRGHYFTGNKMYQNQMRFIKEVAEIENQMKDKKFAEGKRKQFKAQLETSFKLWRSSLKEAFIGKHSPIKEKMTEFRMPISAHGKLRNIDEHLLAAIDKTSGRHRGTMATAAMHVDDVAKFLTMGEIQTFKSAEVMADLARWYDEVGKNFETIGDVLDEMGGDPTRWNKNTRRRILDTFSLLGDKKTDTGGLWRVGKNVKSIQSTLERGARVDSIFKDEWMDIIKEFSSDGASDASDLVFENTNPQQAGLYKSIASSKNIRKYINTARKIASGRDRHYALGSAAFKMIKDMETGVLDFKVRVQGYPELSMLSGSYASLIPVSDSGISDKLREQLVERYGEDEYRMMLTEAKGRIMLPKTLAEAIGRDFDSDPIGLIGISLEKVDQYWEDAGVRDGLLDTINVDRDVAKAMDLEALSAMIQTTTVVESADKKLLPANSMSIGMAYQANKLAEHDYIRKADLKDYLDVHVRARLEGTGYYNTKEIDWLVKTAHDNAKRRVREMYLDKERGPLYIITGTTDDRPPEERNRDAEHKREELIRERLKVMEKKAAGIALSGKELDFVVKEFPDEFYRVVNKASLSSEQELVYRALKTTEKDGWADYIRHFREQSVETFGERKLQTPHAYLAGEAISYLAESYAETERDKAFLTITADKVLSQHALDSKHGTPLILKDMIDQLKYMANPDTRNAKEYFKEHYGFHAGMPEEFFNDFAKGNYIIRLPDGVLNNMEAGGFIKGKTEKVRFQTYENYLVARDEYLSQLARANAEAIRTVGDSYEANKRGEDWIQREHRTIVDSRMSAWKGSKVPGTYKGVVPYQEWMYYGEIVDTAIGENREVIKNLGVSKETLEAVGLKDISKTGREHYIEEHMKYTFPDWRERARLAKGFAKSAQQWHTVQGQGLFEDVAIKALRRYKPTGIEGESIREVLVGMIKRADTFVSNHGNVPMAVENLARRVIGRAAMAIHEQFPDIMAQDYEQRASAYVKNQTRETKRIVSEKVGRMAEGSTPFRRGGILDTLAGKINRINANAADDAMSRSASKGKVGATMMGMFLGALAGQAFNQINTGYAVPDLGETKGIGGEYFDKVSGIMGRETEYMLQPAPPRVVSDYSRDFRRDGEARIMRNIDLALGRTHELKSYQPGFRGTIVR
jgi:hypothetical protein